MALHADSLYKWAANGTVSHQTPTFQFKVFTQVKWDNSCCEMHEVGLNL